jgi:hypothetical protein
MTGPGPRILMPMFTILAGIPVTQGLVSFACAAAESEAA